MPEKNVVDTTPPSPRGIFSYLVKYLHKNKKPANN